MQDLWYAFMKGGEQGLALVGWQPYSSTLPNVQVFGLNETSKQTILKARWMDLVNIISLVDFLLRMPSA